MAPPREMPSRSDLLLLLLLVLPQAAELEEGGGGSHLDVSVFSVSQPGAQRQCPRRKRGLNDNGRGSFLSLP